jgi:hypothetical protein
MLTRTRAMLADATRATGARAVPRSTAHRENPWRANDSRRRVQSLVSASRGT